MDSEDNAMASDSPTQSVSSWTSTEDEDTNVEGASPTQDREDFTESRSI